MTHATAPSLSRPGRRALVVGDLSELRGPTTGVVTVPHRIVWLPPDARRFDLTDTYDRIHLYEVVLREAVHPRELRELLNGTLLTRLWPQLHLPRGVRHAWHTRFPALAAARRGELLAGSVS